MILPEDPALRASSMAGKADDGSPHAPIRLIMAGVGWFIVGTLLAGVTIGLVGRWFVASRFALRSRADTLTLLLIVVLSASAVSLVAVALLKARRIGLGSRALGLGFTPIRRKRAIVGLIAIAVVWPVALSILMLSQPWLAHLAGRTSMAVGLEQARSAALPLLLALGLLVAAVAPIAEELFFRGWLWTGLRRRWGVWPTSVATCLLFLAAHWPEGLYRPLFLVPSAVLMTFARNYGDSVKASIALHIANNSTVVAILLAVALVNGK